MKTCVVGYGLNTALHMLVVDVMFEPEMTVALIEHACPTCSTTGIEDRLTENAIRIMLTVANRTLFTIDDPLITFLSQAIVS